MRGTRHVLAAALASALAVGTYSGSVTAQGEQTQGISDTEIHIGAFGPFAGPVYLYGKLVMNGVEAVFDKANADGGVHGRKLVLVREDDNCKPEGSIAAVKKLAYDEKVFAIIGGACSNATLAAVPELEKAGIPMVINSAVADAITDPPKPNIFSTQLTSSIESRAQLNYALDQGAKKIALVRMTDAWAMARYNPLIEYAKEKGIEFVADVELQIDAPDATPQALKLKASGADAIVMVLYAKPGAVMIRDALKIGYNPIWVGQTAINDFAAFEKQVGIPDALKNFATISAVAFQPTDPEMKPWTDRLKSLFPNDELSTFNMNGIGSAQVLVEALKRAGKDLTRDKLLAALGSIKDFQTDVYAGSITCDAPRSHQCNQNPGWLALRDGKIVRIK
ncbi:MAG: ABC transporter substrate-binding protein [Ectothiorhodospiraceae bacterium]|nr:ABC transporter substrate-binding protein [Ectothiorhodospiraceae bacterium]